MNAYFALSRFLTAYEGMDGEYQIYIQKYGRDLEARLFCVDPSGKLAECLDKGEASVLFSATFLPIRYYKRLLGGTDEDYGSGRLRAGTPPRAERAFPGTILQRSRREKSLP